MRLINFAGNEDRMDEFRRLHPMLRVVFFDAVKQLYLDCGKAFLITSMFRDTGGVHQDGRGLDVDVCDVTMYEGGVTPDEAKRVVNDMNDNWEYDPNRPKYNVAVYKLTGKKADKFGAHINHIHFQVHPRTVAI